LNDAEDGPNEANHNYNRDNEKDVNNQLLYTDTGLACAINNSISKSSWLELMIVTW